MVLCRTKKYNPIVSQKSEILRSFILTLRAIESPSIIIDCPRLKTVPSGTTKFPPQMTWKVSLVWCEICFALKRAQKGWKTKKLCTKKTYLYSTFYNFSSSHNWFYEGTKPLWWSNIQFSNSFGEGKIPYLKRNLHCPCVPLLLGCHCSSARIDCCQQYSSQVRPKRISDYSYSKVSFPMLIISRLQSLLVESFSIAQIDWWMEVWSSYVLVSSAELQQPKL